MTYQEQFEQYRQSFIEHLRGEWFKPYKGEERKCPDCKKSFSIYDLGEDEICRDCGDAERDHGISLRIDEMRGK